MRHAGQRRGPMYAAQMRCEWWRLYIYASWASPCNRIWLDEISSTDWNMNYPTMHCSWYIIHWSCPTCNSIWQLGGIMWFNRFLKLQNRPLRILTCIKNAHTNPIFKKLKLSKIQDIFHAPNLKIYHKYKKAKLPQYFMDMFTIKADIHPYGTRQSSYLHHRIARTAKARKCIRYLLSTLIVTSHFEKMETHGIDGFSVYVKTRTILCKHLSYKELLHM